MYFTFLIHSIFLLASLVLCWLFVLMASTVKDCTSFEIWQGQILTIGYSINFSSTKTRNLILQFLVHYMFGKHHKMSHYLRDKPKHLMKWWNNYHFSSFKKNWRLHTLYVLFSVFVMIFKFLKKELHKVLS